MSLFKTTLLFDTLVNQLIEVPANNCLTPGSGTDNLFNEILQQLLLVKQITCNKDFSTVFPFLRVSSPLLFNMLCTHYGRITIFKLKIVSGFLLDLRVVMM